MPAVYRPVAPLQSHLGSREAYSPVWYVLNVLTCPCPNMLTPLLMVKCPVLQGSSDLIFRGKPAVAAALSKLLQNNIDMVYMYTQGNRTLQWCRLWRLLNDSLMMFHGRTRVWSTVHSMIASKICSHQTNPLCSSAFCNPMYCNSLSAESSYAWEPWNNIKALRSSSSYRCRLWRLLNDTLMMIHRSFVK